MKGRHNPIVAREGLPFLFAAAICFGAVVQFGNPVYSVVPLFFLAWFLLVFRDPLRAIPAVPLGVVSPVDGTVVEVSLTDSGALNSEAHKIFIRVDSLGTYTARCPVEGKIMDFRAAVPESAALGKVSGLWVQTDESEDVVLQFHGHRFGFAPLAFLG